MAGMKKFGKLDLSAAYWQVSLDKDSRKVTTINTPCGLFQFNRLPYRIKSASAIFQKTMEQVVGDTPGVIVYQDDILMGATDSQSLQRLSRKVLQSI